MRSVVVLPAPFGPTSPKKLPAGTVSHRSSTAVFSPKRLRSPAISMAAGAGATGATGPAVGARSFTDPVSSRESPGGGPQPPAWGSLGRPSERSPTMLRWICDVPPQMVSERLKKNADIMALTG